jgi:hypothetical protein
MEIEFNISKPIKLGGRGFMRIIFGAIASKDKEIISNYKKEFSILTNNLLKILQEKYGKETMVTFDFMVEIDNDTKKPKRILVRKVIIWEPFRIIQENIEVTL